MSFWPIFFPYEYRNPYFGGVMEVKRISNFWNLSGDVFGPFGFCILILLIFVAAPGTAAQNAESFESPIPVLLSEKDSFYAVAADPNNYSGSLPKRTTDTFRPGGRVVIFVKNLDLLPAESAGAFRIFGGEKGGKRYRFIVENLSPVARSGGVYALTVRMFDAVGYNGQPADNDGVMLRVSWRGNLSNGVVLRFGDQRQSTSRDHGFPASDAAIQRPAALSSVSQFNEADRTRFMQQATFGPNRALDSTLRRIGLRSWINQQFATPYPTIPYPNFPLKPFDPVTGSCGTFGASPEVDLCHRNHYWNYNNSKWFVTEALYGEDQLRRRVSWALHQIWVISHSNISQQRGTQEYIEILDRNAFGNYRDLMYEMTLNPAMGEYLDMARSTRLYPNENYPRELLQLFTIGLYMLNPDGTLQLDSNGNRIHTYDQAKVDQFTKVFTGWRHCNNGSLPACSSAVPAVPNYIDPMYVSSPDHHDQTAKSLFNYPGAPNSTIQACVNCTDDERRAYANDSLNRALDNIFHHPNVGPFVGKLLIQHLVTSDPSPAFVGRVASAFADNGSGVRGDMKALIRAVLLDPEARGSSKTDPTYGKLRSPIEHLTNLMRLWNVRAGNATSNGPRTAPASCGGRSDGVVDWITRDQGQDLWAPLSVFSYFSPEYVVPGTDVLGPEFAIANTSSSITRNTYTFYLVNGFWFTEPSQSEPYPYTPCGASLDLSEAVSWMSIDPTGDMLIEGLNRKMMHGTMSEAMKSALHRAIDVNVGAYEKAFQLIYLVGSSSQYQIQR